MTWSETRRRAARRVLFPAVEATWAGGASLAGRITRAQARAAAWSPANGHVVVVAAHPDDESLGAGGTIALHVASADDVAVAVVTDGRASRAGGADPDAMADRREHELAAAAAALGVREVVSLRLPEGRWDAADATRGLRAIVGEARVVYAPSVVDFHPEHAKVARVVADLVRPDQLVRIYELAVPLTPVLVNCVADISAVRARKARALGSYESQRVAIAPFDRAARYRAALYRVDAAEVFWQLPGDAYARVMAHGDWRGRDTPFRGIRPRPFTDPLAAIAGLRHRRTLRGAAVA